MNKLPDRQQCCGVFSSLINDLNISSLSCKSEIFRRIHKDVTQLLRRHYFIPCCSHKDYKKDNRETGIEISVYLNNALLALEKKENEILHIYNEKFVILHEASNKTVQPNLPGELADIRYFNYALSYQEIDDLYKKGFNNEVFKTYLQLNSNRSKENMYKISLFNRIKN